jgi:drug/metabolite transporter (DMT)-like permease
MGLIWAVLGAASWVALNYFLPSNSGFGFALLAQIILFIVRKIWLMNRKRDLAAAE